MIIRHVAILLALLQPLARSPKLNVTFVVDTLCNTVSDDDELQKEVHAFLAKAGEPARRQLLERASRAGGPKPWERALLEDLLPLIRSADYATRSDVIWALGQIHDERARAALREALDDLALVDNQWSVVESLGMQRDQISVARFLRMSDGLDPNNPYQATIAEALARIGTPRAVDGMLPIAERYRPGSIEREVLAERLLKIVRSLESARNGDWARGVIERLAGLLR